jgi:GNAT superfamily N-acetyltransferase
MDPLNSPAIGDLSSALGNRVTIRLHERSGGFRDIVGILESKNRITNSKGETITFESDQVAIWREVKPLPDRAGTGAPFSHRILDLEELSNATWPADREVTLGKWRARISDGFTLRANSVLPGGVGPIGEPSEPLVDVVTRVVELYSQAQLVPAFVIPLPIYSDIDEYLESMGWRQKLRAQYLVNETAVEQPLSKDDYLFTTWDFPHEHWLAVAGDENLRKIMERAPATYGAIEFEGNLVGVGRIAIKDSWSIVTRLFIAPEFRGRGLSRFLMDHLTFSARSQGATKVALQVDEENSVAMALYQSMGFRHHHTCSYRELTKGGAL